MGTNNLIFQMMKRFFKLINIFYWNVIASPEKMARHLGVIVGENCLIDTRNWSSEPYLITIGDNVQIPNKGMPI